MDVFQPENLYVLISVNSPSLHLRYYISNLCSYMWNFCVAGMGISMIPDFFFMSFIVLSFSNMLVRCSVLPLTLSLSMTRLLYNHFPEI